VPSLTRIVVHRFGTYIYHVLICQWSDRKEEIDFKNKKFDSISLLSSFSGCCIVTRICPLMIKEG